MSRVLTRLARVGAGFTFISGDSFKLTPHGIPLQNDLDLLMLTMQRNVFAGGSERDGIPADATGDVDLVDWFPVETDNTASQLSSFTDANGATLVVRFRYLVRVSNAAISVTPKILYGATISTISTVATISGQAACSATADDYSGANQYQIVTVTLPSGVKLWKPQVSISGTPAAGYQVWGRACFDCFVSS